MYIKIFSTKQDVASAFADYLYDDVIGVDDVHIALSGGSTPKLVFDVIAEKYGHKIDWSNVHFYWGDERAVPPSDDQSNYKMTVEHLLTKIDIPQENIHRIFGENDPEDEALRYGKILDKQLRTKNDLPCFDLVILGMGDDGHTASIFPYQIELWGSDSNCVVAKHPVSGQARVSITGRVINNAKTVVFLVTGESKKFKLDEILNKKPDYRQYPASLVDPDEGNLYWYLDDEAAAELLNE